ncbi:hypothetical protein P175DRAFT_0431262 [Aspergillus ochraceoroseus IBT 24754]|uniref:Cytochrome b5 heme-binding domain-containing protein n=3 Tax=Aspergillus subgen. Nidulantes TaxID=2720870 RepID=A0A0F8WVQ5_9EURO|nr:uncharacterized protein P175DRAFT_0431262 [Aspergillus ochraceoroseus IBT 24754]KKK15925.1 hypothetical protein AOCH_000641 [Aspergillus ochraceoroseus]KKK21650.1 hypothetical protein ARAM_005504 [Aspergillus rambellii]PTU22834.1 hypothetical protein P175DRAFT_0431262 [Aspergillus ochraceoroseus IBT 24754]
MSDLRQRPIVSAKTTTPKQRSFSSRRDNEEPGRGTGISIPDIIRVLVTVVIVSCGLSYYTTSSESLLWGYRPWFTKWPEVIRYIQGPVILTPDQLALHDGTDPSLPIYLAINGTIFDVSANPHTYGPGGGYHFFTGRDATRAFVTGCFQEDLTDDLTGVEEMFVPLDDPDEYRALTSGQKKIRREQDLRLAKAKVLKQVAHWENFFRNHKKYFEVGKVKVEKTQIKGEEKRELCEAAQKQRPKRNE